MVDELGFACLPFQFFSCKNKRSQSKSKLLGIIILRDPVRPVNMTTGNSNPEGIGAIDCHSTLQFGVNVDTFDGLRTSICVAKLLRFKIDHEGIR